MVNVSPRPETDDERLAVWTRLEQMVFDPDRIYDCLTVAKVRDGMASFLAGYRQVVPLPEPETSRDDTAGCDDVNERN